MLLVEPCYYTDLLTVEPHVPTPDPVAYEKKDAQWYAHEGVNVKETLQRKGGLLLALAIWRKPMACFLGRFCRAEFYQFHNTVTFN